MPEDIAAVMGHSEVVSFLSGALKVNPHGFFSSGLSGGLASQEEGALRQAPGI